MAGLITVNKLLEMLLTEVHNFDFASYQQLLLQKINLTEAVKTRNASPAHITQLQRVLSKQVKAVSYYAQNLPRLERIVNILMRAKKSTGVEYQDIYEKLVKLLQTLANALRKDFLGILRNQAGALKAKNSKLYLQLAEKETEIYKALAGPLSRLGISIEKKLKEQGITPRSASIRLKIALAVSLSVIPIIISVVSIFYPVKLNLFLTAQPNVQTYWTLIQSQNITILKDCAYELGIQFGDANNIKSLNETVSNYLQQDLSHELQLEAMLEAVTKTNILGEYTVDELLLLKDTLEKTYGTELARYANIKSITFLPKTAKFSAINLSRSCPSINVAGEAQPGRIILASSALSSLDFFRRTIVHEVAHQIHYKVRSEFPQFDKEWQAIKGGYAWEHGMSNYYEDVATVADTVLEAFLEGRNPNALVSIDGNNQALHAKIMLLKKYGFFPPHIAALLQ